MRTQLQQWTHLTNSGMLLSSKTLKISRKRSKESCKKKLKNQRESKRSRNFKWWRDRSRRKRRFMTKLNNLKPQAWLHQHHSTLTKTIESKERRPSGERERKWPNLCTHSIHLSKKPIRLECRERLRKERKCYNSLLMKTWCSSRKDTSKRLSSERYKSKTSSPSSSNATFCPLSHTILPPKMCYLMFMRRRIIKPMNIESVTTRSKT